MLTLPFEAYLFSILHVFFSSSFAIYILDMHEECNKFIRISLLLMHFKPPQDSPIKLLVIH